MPAEIAALAFLLATSLSSAEELPPWLKELAKVQITSYDPKPASIVLLNQEATTVVDSGKLSTTRRSAIKILTRQGAPTIFYDQYDSGSGKVRDFRAWTISPSGKVYKYGSNEILDVACVDNDVYNECRRRAVSAGRDSEAGSIFAYESVIEYRAFSNQFTFHFQNSSPVRLARFVLTVPSGWEVKSNSFNGTAPATRASDGTYVWQMENLPAFEREPSSPSLLTLAPWVGVNVLGSSLRHPLLSWSEAAKLLTELNDGKADPTSGLTAKATALVEGAATEFDKIVAIGRFTQQVNYTSIQVDVYKGGGYQPHSAAQTFEKLYGDCKDKANLTRAMLKAVGITAYPVAIYSGDRTHVTREWPSLGVFNHAISAIRVGAETKAPAVLEHPRLGRLLFFDPTDPYVPPGYLPGHEQASLALVGAGELGDLVQVPAALPSAAAHDRRVEATLGADGSITGHFVDRRTSEALGEAITRYRASKKNDYVKSIEQWVGTSIPGARTTGIEISSEPAEFVLKAQFASPSFAQRPQARMMIFRAALLRQADLRLAEKIRKYPLMVDADALRETVRIRLPAGFKVDEMPDSVRIDSDFGKYEATWAAESNALVFTRTFEMAAQTVRPDRYPEFKAFVERMASASASPVVLVQ